MEVYVLILLLYLETITPELKFYDKKWYFSKLTSSLMMPTRIISHNSTKDVTVDL